MNTLIPQSEYDKRLRQAQNWIGWLLENPGEVPEEDQLEFVKLAVLIRDRAARLRQVDQP